MSEWLECPPLTSGSDQEALPNIREWYGGLPDFLEWSGDPPGHPGVVGRPTRMSRSGLETLLDVWEWFGALPYVREWLESFPDVWQWSGGLPGCPGVVGRPIECPGVVGRPSGMFGSSCEAFPEVHKW